MQEETPSHLSVESTSEQSLESAPSTSDSLATSIIEKEQQEQSTSPFESQQEQEHAAADESELSGSETLRRYLIQSQVQRRLKQQHLSVMLHNMMNP